MGALGTYSCMYVGRITLLPLASKLVYIILGIAAFMPLLKLNRISNTQKILSAFIFHANLI